MKVINLFGGPGAGKSTVAAGLFYTMKMQGLNVELVTEYAKDATWDERHFVLKDQFYISAKQNRRLERLKNKVEYVVTDSPSILGAMYAPDDYYKLYKPFLFEVFNSYDNFNIFLERKDREYRKVGRTQTEDEARELDDKTRNMLDANQIPYHILQTTEAYSAATLLKLLEDL